MRYGGDYGRPRRRTVGEMGGWRNGAWTWHGDRSDPYNRERPVARRYGGEYRALRPGFREGYPRDYAFRARDRYDAGLRRGPATHRAAPSRPTPWWRHPTPGNVR